MTASENRAYWKFVLIATIVVCLIRACAVAHAEDKIGDWSATDDDYRVLIERVKRCIPAEKFMVRYDDTCESGWKIGPIGRMTLKTGRVWNVPARCLVEKEIIEIFMVCPMRFELP